VVDRRRKVGLAVRYIITPEVLKKSHEEVMKWQREKAKLALIREIEKEVIERMECGENHYIIGEKVLGVPAEIYFSPVAKTDTVVLSPKDFPKVAGTIPG
jgi:gluconate kinase